MADLVAQDIRNKIEENYKDYPDVLSFKEAEHFLGCKRGKIDQLCEEKKIIYFQDGKSKKFPKIFLIDFVCNNVLKQLNI